MRRVAHILLALALLPVSASADSFRAMLEDAWRAMESGNPDKAISIYRELQTEQPESDLLHFNMGCARYEQGMQAIEAGASEEGVESLRDAREYFERVMASADPRIRMDARYDRANTIAQIAKHGAGPGRHEQTVEAFETAIRAYEEILGYHPDHAQARNNLDHMRYILKQMLQNPPPPQEQEQEQQRQDQEQEEEEEQQDNGQQEQDGEDEQETDPQDGEDEEQQQDAEQQEPDHKEEEQQQGEEDRSGEPDSPERQDIEALLESLEDVDQQEQRDMRRGPPGSPAIREWW